MVAKSIAKMYTNIHKPTDYSTLREHSTIYRTASYLTNWTA